MGILTLALPPARRRSTLVSKLRSHAAEDTMVPMTTVPRTTLPAKTHARRRRILKAVTGLALLTGLAMGCHRRGESVREARTESMVRTRGADDRLPIATPRGETYPAGPSADQAIPGGPATPALPRPAVSTRTVRDRTVVLTGAAALMYLYHQHQALPERLGHDGKWYLSPQGRVYWLDPHRHAREIHAPADGIEVTVEEGQKYRPLQGYANRTVGRGLAGIGRDPEP